MGRTRPSQGSRQRGATPARSRLGQGEKHQGRRFQRVNQPHVIGVISDTHGLLRPEAIQALQGSELIIHAGDVGKPEILAGLGRGWALHRRSLVALAR